MPELPEVEITRRGIESHLNGRCINRVIVRQKQLRFPVTAGVEKNLIGCKVKCLSRRGKYLLIYTDSGALILHLGMSGSLRIVTTDTPPTLHDHFDLIFANRNQDERVLRFRDPRKFGVVLWTHGDPLQHALLVSLGVEPLDQAFDGAYLYQKSRARKVSIKQFIMDAKIVVGIGNIYASEALFLSGIHPMRRAGCISMVRYNALVVAIKKVLKNAIKKGGTTLKDFVQENGRPGYFQFSLKVYGRDGLPCFKCSNSIVRRTIGQRSSFYCVNCQT